MEEEACQEEESKVEAEMPNQPNRKENPGGMLPIVFEGDHSKAESFIREFSTYLLVNHDISALTSFF